MIRSDTDPTPRPQRSRWYWVLVDGNGAADRRKVAAYDADDAVAQFRLAFPAENVMGVEPFGKPGPDPIGVDQLYVGYEGYARMMGFSSSQTARARLTELEAEGLSRLGNRRGARFKITEIIRIQDEIAARG